MSTDASAAPSVVSTLKELSSIVDNLLLLLSDKEKEVIIKRFSLYSERRFTLEEIGQDFAVTRERIRQIEKSALAKLRRNVFNTSLHHLHLFAEEAVSQSGGLLPESALFDFFGALVGEQVQYSASNLYLALVLSDRLECVGNTITFHPHVRHQDIPSQTLKHISSQLYSELKKSGKVRPLEAMHPVVTSELPEQLPESLDFLKSLVAVDKRITLMDNDCIALLEWRHVNPRTLRDKILYVLRQEQKAIHFNVIARHIERLSFNQRKVNIQAVHNELIRHPQFVLIGRGIYALAEWGYQRGTVSDVISEILKKHGELAQDDIVELVLKQRQVKKITVVLSLKNDALFERTGRKRYQLRK